MVRAILDGRKTVTRRIMKPLPELLDGETMTPVIQDDGNWTFQIHPWTNYYDGEARAPCCKGDILYVRETWKVQAAHRFEADARIEFRAGGQMTTIQFPGRCSDSHERPTYDDFIRKWGVASKWHPSLHMPKEAARIFLRVKDVRAERLQDITEEQAQAEGCYAGPLFEGGGGWIEARYGFSNLWDRTIKDNIARETYGWDANPWVFVIEFERISKEEAMKC
jgi:hypothetical protein